LERHTHMGAVRTDVHVLRDDTLGVTGVTIKMLESRAKCSGHSCVTTLNSPLTVQFAGNSSSSTTQESTNASAMSAAMEPDLTARMRRLSVGSDFTSYSLVSDAPSVHSLDSNGSVTGGVAVASLQGLPIRTKAPMTTARVIDLPSTIPETIISKDTDAGLLRFGFSCSLLRGPNYSAKPTNPNEWWSAFPGFTPDPTARFKQEFARLAKEQGWDTVTKKNMMPEALMAEVEHHYSGSWNRLDRWQDLCKDLGLEDIPTSITKCRTVCNAAFVTFWKKTLTMCRRSGLSTSICST
jgi:hypothetical protein